MIPRRFRVATPLGLLVGVLLVILFDQIVLRDKNRPADLSDPGVFAQVILANSQAVAEHRLASCVVPKTMSTATGAVLCHLKSGDNSRWTHNPFCDSEIVAVSLGAFKASYQLTNSLAGWKLLFVKRHPIDRFLSGFIDRCVRLKHECHGCFNDLGCYVDKLHESLRQVTFAPDDIDIDDFHVAPQNWFCQMGTMMSRLTFVRYSADVTDSYFSDLDKVLRAKTSNETRAYIAEKLISNSAVHETRSSRIRVFLEKFLYSRPDLLDVLNSIYYWDFVFLGYSGQGP